MRVAGLLVRYGVPLALGLHACSSTPRDASTAPHASAGPPTPNVDPPTPAIKPGAAPDAPPGDDAFAALEDNVPKDARPELDTDELTAFIAGRWKLRVWKEADPSLVLIGTLHCRERETVIERLSLLLCEGRARRDPASEDGPRFELVNTYMFSRFYEVLRLNGRNGQAFYSKSQRFLDQLIPLSHDRLAHDRFVFDPSGRYGRFRLATTGVDRVEVDRSEAIRGVLERLPAEAEESAPEPVTEVDLDVDLDECRSTVGAGPRRDTVVDLVGNLAIVLPRRERWQVECGTEETRIPFRATRMQGDSMQAVTLEVPDIEPDSVWNEHHYVLELAALFGLRAAQSNDWIEDHGEISLAQDHVARLLRVQRSERSGIAGTTLHGFAVRRWGREVAVLHVSETRKRGEPSEEHVRRILSMFETSAPPAPAVPAALE